MPPVAGLVWRRESSEGAANVLILGEGGGGAWTIHSKVVKDVVCSPDDFEVGISQITPRGQMAMCTFFRVACTV